MTGCWWNHPGVYDVDEFFDVRDEPLDRWYEIGNVITVVNAKLEPKLSDMSEYLLASEAAHAGSDGVKPCGRSDGGRDAGNDHASEPSTGEGTLWYADLDQEIIRKGSLSLMDADFAKDSAVRLCAGKLSENGSDRENSFDTVYVMERKMTVEEILAGMKKIFADPSCGKSSGSKDLCRKKTAAGLEVNATRHELQNSRSKKDRRF